MPKVTRDGPGAPPKHVDPRVPGQGALFELDGWAASESIRMLLYGQSGSGKTTLWATFPKPILALLCSGGNRPGELKSIDTPQNRRTIRPRIINSMLAFHEQVEAAAKGEYKTVVLDHASGLQDLIIKELLGLDDYLIAKYKTAGKGESWSVISKQQYGQLAIQCKEAFKSLLNLRSNVVIVAQEKLFGAEGESEVIRPTVGAALTPSVTGWLNPACDYVVQMFKRARTEDVEYDPGTGEKGVTKVRVGGPDGPVDYCLRCAPHDIYMTKFRLPRGHELPDVIIDPTYDKIKEVIEGKGE